MAMMVFAAPREDFQHYHGIAGPIARTKLGAPPDPATVHGFAHVLSVRGGNSAVVNSHYTFPFEVQGDEREPLTLTCKAWLKIGGQLRAAAGRYDPSQLPSEDNSLMAWADARIRVNVQLFEMPARREIVRLDLDPERLDCATKVGVYFDTIRDDFAPLVSRLKRSQAQVGVGRRYELTIYVDMVVSTYSFNADHAQFPNAEDPEAKSRLEFDNPQEGGIFASLALS
jgi:hypothetical protein